MDIKHIVSQHINPIIEGAGINMLCEFLYKNINDYYRPTVKDIIKRAVKRTLKSVGDYQKYPQIVDELVERFDSNLFTRRYSQKMEDIFLREFNIVLNKYDLQNLQYQNEFIKVFFFFFIGEMQKDDILWRKIENDYLKNLYDSVLDIKQETLLHKESLKHATEEVCELLFHVKFGDIRHHIYVSKLSSLAGKWNLKYDSMKPLFHDLFVFLERKVRNTWKERCVDYLKNIDVSSYMQGKAIGSLLEKINTSASCEELSKDIGRLVSALEGENKSIVYQILKMNYDKCFIVSGEPGSGKTEFLHYSLEYFKDCPDIYVIPIEQGTFLKCRDKMDLESAVLKSINYYLETNFQRMSDILDFSERNEGFRIVIAIDNLQRIEYVNHGIWNLLVEAIKTYSGINSLFWIICVSEYDMYIFEEVKEKDFLRYVVKDREFWHGNSSLFEYDFNLTIYNQKNKVGTKILKSYDCKGVNILREVNNEVVLKSVENPLIAHFIGEKKADLGKLQLKSFYVDFAESIVKYLQNKINMDIRDADIRVGGVSEEIENLAQYIIKKDTIIISDEDIDRMISSRLKTILMQNEFLINIESRVENDFLSERFGSRDVHFQFYFNLYWANRVAVFSGLKKIMEQESIAIEELKEILDRKEYKEEICEYALYFLDRQTQTGNVRVFIEILNDIGMLYILFVYMERLSHRTKSRLLSIIKEGKLSLKRKDVYCMIYALNAEKMSLRDKYEIIKLYALQIEKYDTNFCNFEGLFRQLVYTYDKVECLLDDMSILLNTEANKLNTIMGSMFANRFVKIQNLGLKYEIQVLNKFIENNKDILKGVDRRNTKHKRNFFDEFFKQFFYLHISKDGLRNIYDTLSGVKEMRKKGWRGGIYRYNFTRAAGDYFVLIKKKNAMMESEQYRKEYIEIVNELIKTKRAPDMIFAFHLITNSLENDRCVNEKLDEELILSLRKIANMRGLEKFKADHKEFFNRVDENAVSDKSKKKKHRR